MAPRPCGSASLASAYVTLEFFALIGIGFVAQLVDGALGMAFGLISTTALLSLGIPPPKPALRFILPKWRPRRLPGSRICSTKT